eukprot:1186880-Prorocentrum_minimum.AAC.3
MASRRWSSAAANLRPIPKRTTAAPDARPRSAAAAKCPAVGPRTRAAGGLAAPRRCLRRRPLEERPSKLSVAPAAQPLRQGPSSTTREASARAPGSSPGCAICVPLGDFNGLTRAASTGGVLGLPCSGSSVLTDDMSNNGTCASPDTAARSEGRAWGAVLHQASSSGFAATGTAKTGLPAR